MTSDLKKEDCALVIDIPNLVSSFNNNIPEFIENLDKILNKIRESFLLKQKIAYIYDRDERISNELWKRGFIVVILPYERGRDWIDITASLNSLDYFDNSNIENIVFFSRDNVFCMTFSKLRDIGKKVFWIQLEDLGIMQMNPRDLPKFSNSVITIEDENWKEVADRFEKDIKKIETQEELVGDEIIEKDILEFIINLIKKLSEDKNTIGYFDCIYLIQIFMKNREKLQDININRSVVRGAFQALINLGYIIKNSSLDERLNFYVLGKEFSSEAMKSE